MSIIFIVLINFVVFTVATPRRFPYVFLLEVGNDELEKTNSEQVRISAPGGAIAIKYPALENGDGGIITHVRVSGIDFGTNVKASLLEGGPGYNYVVVLLDGNKGRLYDAVVTVDTLPRDDWIADTAAESVEGSKVSEDDTSAIGIINSDSKINNDENIIGTNNNAEELDYVEEDPSRNQNSHAELTQSSKKIYKYDKYDDTNMSDDSNLNDYAEGDPSITHQSTAKITQSSAMMHKYHKNEISGSDFDKYSDNEENYKTFQNNMETDQDYGGEENDSEDGFNKNLRTSGNYNNYNNNQSEEDINNQVNLDLNQNTVRNDQTPNNNLYGEDFQDYNNNKVKFDPSTKKKSYQLYENEDNNNYNIPSVKSVNFYKRINRFRNTIPYEDSGNYNNDEGYLDHADEPGYIKKDPYQDNDVDVSYDDEEVHKDIHADGYRDRNHNNKEFEDGYAASI